MLEIAAATADPGVDDKPQPEGSRDTQRESDSDSSTS